MVCYRLLSLNNMHLYQLTIILTTILSTHHINNHIRLIISNSPILDIFLQNKNPDYPSYLEPDIKPRKAFIYLSYYTSYLSTLDINTTVSTYS